MKDLIFVVPCGSKKQSTPMPANRLYIGSLFLTGYRWAWSHNPSPGNLYILSARHGLILPTKVIAPYNVKMGDLGSVTVEVVRGQAAIFDGRKIVSLCGNAYDQVLKQAVPNNCEIRRPVTNVGMGYMAQWYNQHLGRGLPF